MGVYKYVRDLWKDPKGNLGNLWQERLIEWRKDPATVRILRPTRIDRARALGYKAKQGYVILRQRLTRGGRMRPQIRSGRRPKHNRRKKVLGMNYQQIAEQRANTKHPNLEVVNSYYVGHDGISIWYEVILIDRNHPSILADKRISGVAGQTRRVFRGLTSAGKKSRGLRNKGTGAEKIRPGRRAKNRKSK